MATDIEKRKVVSRLREYASWDEDGELVGCTEFGEAVLNLLSCGDTERECFNAIADLIEPEPERTCRDTDCDALLRLARYMDKDVAETEEHFSNVISTKSVSDYARRIREALGVES